MARVRACKYGLMSSRRLEWAVASCMAGWAVARLTAADRPMLLFLSRFIEEQLLSLSEATGGRVDRKAMLRVLDLTEGAVVKAGEA